MDITYSKALEDIFGFSPLPEVKASIVELVPSFVQKIIVSTDIKTLESILLELTRISKFAEIEFTTLIKLCEKQLCEYATEHLTSNIQATLFIARIYAIDIPEFLKLKLSHVLPFAFCHSGNVNLIKAIATQLNVNVKDLCTKNIHHILVGGLLEINQQQFQNAKDNLDTILGTSDTFNRQLKSNRTKVTSLLALELGYKSKRPLVEEAFVKVIQWTGFDQSYSLGKYLSAFFIAILDRVRTFISEKRQGSKDVSHPQTLNALNYIVTLLSSDVQIYALQLIATIQIVENIPGLQKDAFVLWQTFIAVLDKESISMHLPSIIEGLLRIFPHLDNETKNSIACVMYEILFERSILTPRLLQRLPELPAFKELRYVKKSIDERILEFNGNNGNYIETLLDSLFTEDFATILPILNRLERFLKEADSKSVKKLKENSRLFSLLLKLSKKTILQDEVKIVAATCLGLLGATDPSRLVIVEQDDSYVFLGHFEDKIDARDFICNLIETQLVPSFLASTNERVHQCLQFTIQELLSQAGFRDRVSETSGMNREVRNRWRQLPVKLQSMLHPLLSSSFESEWSITPLEYPIYPKVHSFSEWLKGWYYRLVEDSKGNTHNLFSACIPAVDSGKNGLVFHLIPYMIVHFIITENHSTTINIPMELTKVLEINSTDNDRDENLRQDSLQAVVHITAYCRKWIQQRQKGHNKTPSVHVNKVRHFLGLMSDKLMSMASYRSKAYAQALMHEEAYIRSSPRSAKKAINESLWRIYAQMNDVDGLDASFSNFDIPLSEEMGIMWSEREAQWGLAAEQHLNHLVASKLGPQHYDGYFKCLRNEGAYETMFYRASELGDKYPESVLQINALMAEATMKLSQWDTLGKLVNRPMAETFESLLALAYSSIHSKRNVDTFYYITKARLNIMRILSTLTTASYQSSHDCILRLQLLQEIEKSQIVFEKAFRSNASESGYKLVEDLFESWNYQFKLVAPDYPTRKEILTSRIRAMYSVREESIPDIISMKIKRDTGSMWLLLAKTAREAGDMHTAFEAIQKAETLKHRFTCIEKAKWYWENQHRDRAILVLKFSNSQLKERDLLLIRYQEESLSSNVNIKNEYRGITIDYPKWEEGHFALCTFYERQLEIVKKSYPLGKYVYSLVVVIRSYMKALGAGSQMYNRTMPRMLTLWLELNENYTMALNEKTPAEFNDHFPLTAASRRDIVKRCEDAAGYLSKDIDGIKPYQLALVLPRLISRLAHDKGILTTPFIGMIKTVFFAYPRMAVWPLLAALESPSTLLKEQCKQILEDVQIPEESRTKTGDDYKKIIHDAKLFIEAMRFISDLRPETFTHRETNLSQYPIIKSLKNLDLYIPQELALIPRLPESEDDDDYTPFPQNLPKIQGIDSRACIMQSLQKPKRIVLIGSDGKRYGFLCKTNDDLRRDARVMEFCYMINNLLRKDPEARARSLYIRTYAVVPLGHEWGLLQWVENLETLKSITIREYKKHGISYQARYEAAKEIMDPTTKPAIPPTSQEKKERFITKVLPKFPCYFNDWFLDCFPEPSLWLAARNRYTNTLAVMSIVGYVLGLGDRHSENILFDSLSGDCIHVDLNMLFDKGSDLPVPEIVPFRLTQNLVDALGVLGYKGKFEETCRVTMRVLRENKESLLSVFETFVHDPVSYKTQAPHAARRNKNDAKYIINNMAEKISGAALSKSAESSRAKGSRSSTTSSSSSSSFNSGAPASSISPTTGITVVEQVAGLIHESCKVENLANMYFGWAPFL
ncbi:hypothetical protein CLU79DRAFT_834655 [Phycomyces nitens]|nr:hypothetical protein CLU79DRAFT_834655 [Phycomyces nitens]